nr:multidrug resistance-associated protein 5 [Tanacetum cinerariifolium]
MIPDTDLHQFDVHNDGYFSHLPLNYVDGVILEMVVPIMSYEQLAEFSEEKCGCYFQGVYYQVPSQDLEKVLVRVSDDRNSTTEGVEARTKTKDNEKEKVSEDASDVVETRRCTVEADTRTEYESDDNSDYQSDKSVDYLSPGEDEIIELGNRMKANRNKKAKAKDKPNLGMNEPNKENNMPANNVRGETFKEHDIYMNELLKSLKTADKDGITEDPFLSGEERVVAKCGQRPPNVPAPEKGKQRKQTKYHCASSDALRKCPWRCYARKIIALDGCFLKKPNQGEILTTIGRDEDLGCSRGNGLTLMSDQHKSLIEAVKDVMLNAEHRQCARHIYENFRKQYPGLEFRQLFWAASKALYPHLFNKIMDKIKSANLNAHKFWHVIPTGGKIFEVRSESEGFSVDEGKRTCSCRMCQLSGLPCVHATKSMYSTFLPPKPRKMPGRPKQNKIIAIGEGGSSTRVSKVEVVSRPRKKQPSDTFDDVDVVQRGLVRDEGASGTRGGRGAGGSGDASGSRGKGTAGLRGGASGSRGRDAGGSKRKPMPTAETQKRQEKTQAEPQQTQHKPEQTQVEDQVEQTEDQAEIDLTQVEQTQEQTQEQVQPQK